MATFTDVFERKEVKYRLSASQHAAMVRALDGRMALDQYGRTRVCSLYLDTPDRSLIERSLDKPVYKEKLRLRWYGDVQADSRTFIEIKKKFKGIVYKRRVGCSYAAAQAYARGASYKGACARFPLPAAQEAAESLAPRSLQIAREIDQFALLHGPLVPSMLIACDRMAYASVEDEGGVRITFDENVRYRDLRAGDPCALADEGMTPLLRQGDAVMEIKVAGPFPLWLVRALRACDARPTSFSKYGEAYKTCMARAAASAAYREEVPLVVRASKARPVPLPAPAHAATFAANHRRVTRSVHAAHADAAERLVPAAHTAVPRRYSAPAKRLKKGGRCA